ncbi:MAG: hypothetical protein AVDCRST_MAG54-1664, partial [uncultured Actinomycetospora sp.]
CPSTATGSPTSRRWRRATARPWPPCGPPGP